MYVSLRCKILQGSNKGIVVTLMSSMKLLTSSMKLPFIKVYTLFHTSDRAESPKKELIFMVSYQNLWASLVAQTVKNLPTMQIRV